MARGHRLSFTNHLLTYSLPTNHFTTKKGAPRGTFFYCCFFALTSSMYSFMIFTAQ